MSSLVIAEHDNNQLKPATLNTVTAAVQCGGEVHVLVAGHNAAAVAQAAAQIAGVTKVIHADAEGYAHGLAENMAAQVLALAPAYSHILFAATASGKNIAPRVAASLDVGQVSDITQVIKLPPATIRLNPIPVSMPAVAMSRYRVLEKDLAVALVSGLVG